MFSSACLICVTCVVYMSSFFLHVTLNVCMLEVTRWSIEADRLGVMPRLSDERHIQRQITTRLEKIVDFVSQRPDVDETEDECLTGRCRVTVDVHWTRNRVRATVDGDGSRRPGRDDHECTISCTANGGRAFPAAAAQAWNSLPSHVTSSSSLASFKRSLKTELFLRSYVQAWYRLTLHVTFLTLLRALEVNFDLRHVNHIRYYYYYYYVCMCNVHVCVCICMQTMHICIYVHICVYVHIYACVYICLKLSYTFIFV